MNELKTLARPYAVAAYDFAQQNNRVDLWLYMLSAMRSLLTTERMKEIVNAPNYDSDVLLAALQPFTKQVLDCYGLNFLKLLISHRRLPLISEIYDLFDSLKAKAENRLNVKVTTAIALNSEEEKRLKDALTKALNKNIVPTFDVNETIIGGAIIRVGNDDVFDGSLKTQLDRLKASF